MSFLKKIILFIVFSFATVVFAAPDGSNIIITEVMPDAVQPGVDNEYEWAELYNPTNTIIDINGWEIIDGAGNNHIFDNATENTLMNPGEYRLLVFDATDTPPNGRTDSNGKSFEIGYPGVLGSLPANSDYIDLVDAIRLNNSGGDSLELCTGVCNGSNSVDYFEWQDFSGSGLWNGDAGPGTGNSLCRDGIIDTDTENDWSTTACNTDPTNTVNDGSPGTGVYGIYDVVITESLGTTIISETLPSSDDYTIALGSSPSGTETVTVAILTDAQCSTDILTVNFNTTNWNIPQTITVTAVDDAFVEPSPHDCNITHITTSSNTSSGYHNLITAGLTANVNDNDLAGLTVVPSGSDTVISEDGSQTDTVNIVLDTDPGAGNTITVICTDDGQSLITNPAMPLLFNSLNYQTGFTLDIVAVDDANVEPDTHNSTINCGITASDNTIDYPLGMTVSINIDIIDNDELEPKKTTSASGTRFACKDSLALNYSRFGRHKSSLCEYSLQGNNTENPAIIIPDVLAEVSNCPYFNEYHKINDRNGEVILIQTFLNQYYSENLDIDGVYGLMTSAAVSRFQTRWFDEILAPWGLTLPTGRWYQSTRNKANEVAGCDEGKISLDNGVTLN